MRHLSFSDQAKGHAAMAQAVLSIQMKSGRECLEKAKAATDPQTRDMYLNRARGHVRNCLKHIAAEQQSWPLTPLDKLQQALNQLSSTIKH